VRNFEKGDVSNMVYGIDRWFEEARLNGKKEGKEEAYAEKIKMVKNLIRLGLSNTQISEATDFTMSEDKIEELRVGN
jgi:predicted transposase YdaD